jgi:hypothetical protein
VIDDLCPNCKAVTPPGNDRDVQTCKACGKDYMTVQMGWCFHNIPHPHDCSEHMKTYGSVTLCSMCGTSNEASTRARIEMLRAPENKGNDLAEGLASALEGTLGDKS